MVEEGATGAEWWADPLEVKRVRLMLFRAGCLVDDDDGDYFLEKPWKWSKARDICDLLERAMSLAGVPVSTGWDVTPREFLGP